MIGLFLPCEWDRCDLTGFSEALLQNNVADPFKEEVLLLQVKTVFFKHIFDGLLTTECHHYSLETWKLLRFLYELRYCLLTSLDDSLLKRHRLNEGGHFATLLVLANLWLQ